LLRSSIPVEAQPFEVAFHRVDIPGFRPFQIEIFESKYDASRGCPGVEPAQQGGQQRAWVGASGG
jgi:hypothetical protein